jgi:hypothetical protein
MDNEVGIQIERLTKQADGKIVEIAGRTYSTTPLHDPRKAEAVPETVAVHTLQGFAELVKGEEDGAYHEERGIFVHVASSGLVRLLTGIFGEFHQRVELARATAIVPGVTLGSFHDPETFIIDLLANYEPAGDREKVFEIVGNLKTEAVTTVADDGVTQQATAKAGVVRAANVHVPNPVMLRPYRTFREVEQPTSPFVLRLRGGGEGRMPSCALFECDGGQWRLDAIKAVKEWLQGELPDVAVYG